MSTQDRLAVPIPKFMRILERDRRGLPIPFVVLRDKDGVPMFSLNNSRRLRDCRTKKLCSVCGRRLTDAGWFVGGVRSFLNEAGAFRDPPTHYECAEYSLLVCPFLAARSYTKPIEAKKFDPAKVPAKMQLVVLPPDKDGPPLPERFGLGLCTGYDHHVNHTQNDVYEPRGWVYVEFWKHGAPCGAPPRGDGL